MRAHVIALTLVVLAQATASHAHDWKPAITYGALGTADILSTWGGERAGCFEGEANPRYWTSGRWQDPDYAKMAADTAVLTGAVAAINWLLQREYQKRPNRATRWGVRVMKGVTYVGAARRGVAAVRTLARC